MSRFLYRSLTRGRVSLWPPAPFITHHHRHGSSKTRQLAEADIDADSPEAGSAEATTVGMKRFEEAVNSIIVRQAAPDWLPFLPGYSYWVPPRATSFRICSTAGSWVEAIAELSSPGATMNSLQELSEDEQMSLNSTNGWPSYAFYVEGTLPMHPVPVEVEMQDTKDKEDGTSNSMDGKR